ncbi:2-oxo acid dehydrogenase subunit E2 [Aldersonia sp. NBC_00410]|uniref:dihydrolipoamide acetyltransferase family protein n=1 Tax=Aldersonia sp. NBC_00410 TaxID=2975954 RepID=UPI00225BCC2F|nr:dihydrolipoamide acetyltransferase family protein [Aldersonia sp. NBC_00410]MCX5043627.1 2-oxo acid dehydrogenase subunit E2 [Aldersonia sp. NBC_00410]
MTTQEFCLPDLGEGLTDAELVSWAIAPGDVVTLNQNVAEVETAKALVELPSPFAGTVTELLAEPGDTVAVGAPLLRITTDTPAGTTPPAAAESAPNTTARQAVLVGYGPSDAPVSRRRRPPAEPAAATTNGTAAPARPDAVPAARKRARELGIDLTEVIGTGASGAITFNDVEAHTDLAPSEPSARETRIPIAGVRKRTAAAMALSARTIPQVTEFVTCDVSASVELLDRLRTTAAFDGVKLTPLALVAKTVIAALADHPTLNSRWDEDSQEIVLHHFVNLGIAVASPRGLLVPKLADAGRHRLPDLAAELTRTIEVARSGAATPADLTGATFTLTNVGSYGIDTGTPMVNPGEAAILCLGTFAKRPWVLPGTDDVVARWVTTLGLSFDHRLVDGEQASKFLADVAAMLTDPGLLLTRL